MNKNIFKVLLLILLAISFVRPAKALNIKSETAYECYILVDVPALMIQNVMIL